MPDAKLSTATRRSVLLHVMPPEAREVYFAAHPLDAERVRRANAKRNRKASDRLFFAAVESARVETA